MYQQSYADGVPIDYFIIIWVALHEVTKLSMKRLIILISCYDQCTGTLRNSQSDPFLILIVLYMTMDNNG